MTEFYVAKFQVILSWYVALLENFVYRIQYFIDLKCHLKHF